MELLLLLRLRLKVLRLGLLQLVPAYVTWTFWLRVRWRPLGLLWLRWLSCEPLCRRCEPKLRMLCTGCAWSTCTRHTTHADWLLLLKPMWSRLVYVRRQLRGGCWRGWVLLRLWLGVLLPEWGWLRAMLRS